MTTKPPTWRDPLIQWPEQRPTLGQAHEGFFYPDPLGFWAEVRKWAVELLRRSQPAWAAPEALAVTALLHVGSEAGRLSMATDLLQPRVVLFLDEHSWLLSQTQLPRTTHHIADPHRPGQVYEGFWGVTDGGRVIGKSPQHPTTHNLYRAEEMAEFLQAAPGAD